LVEDTAVGDLLGEGIGETKMEGGRPSKKEGRVTRQVPLGTPKKTPKKN